MKINKSALGVLGLSVLLYVIGYILMHPYEFGFCQKAYQFNDHITCVDNISLVLGKPLKLYSQPLIAISLVMLFLRKEILKSWLKFSVPWSLITLLFVSYVPTIDSSIYAIQKDTVTMFMSVLLALVTFILIIYKSIKLRGQNPKSTSVSS